MSTPESPIPDPNDPTARLDTLLVRMLDRTIAMQQNPFISAVYSQYIRPDVVEAAEKHLSPRKR